MESVKFQCGHCGNLMGVETAFLGQQVRCPHCQQIVLVPSIQPEALPLPDVPSLESTAEQVPASPTPDSVSAFEIRSATDQDSIFSADDSAGDGLFEEALPKVEMPQEAEWPVVTNDSSRSSSPSMPELQPGLEATFFAVPEEGARELTSIPPVAEAALSMPAPLFDSSQPSSTVLAPPDPSLESASASAPAHVVDDLAPVLSPQCVRMPRSRPWLVPLLFIPLVSYSILATIAAALLYMEKQRQVHPLEAIPDQGENKGASRTKSSSIKWPDPAQRLPDRLKVELGQAFRLGDLEVIPEKVERRQIQYESTAKNAPQDSTQFDVLALVLRLKNISKDVVFKPMDPYFTRQWRPKNGGLMPYTYLSLGDHTAYGGPLSLQEMHDHHLGVVDQNLNKELQPGEEMTTFVCTDPEDPVSRILDQRKDKETLIWRVQVRRGLVQVHDREVPATAVIGVQFSQENIQ
jgi:DNA-directed RNA polymerase subunit RPC12/RpoP